MVRSLSRNLWAPLELSVAGPHCRDTVIKRYCSPDASPGLSKDAVTSVAPDNEATPLVFQYLSTQVSGGQDVAFSVPLPPFTLPHTSSPKASAARRLLAVMRWE